VVSREINNDLVVRLNINLKEHIMSVGNFFGDLISGNFSNALKRLEDLFSSLSPQVHAFIEKLASDEGKLLQTLAESALQSVITGGFSTASFVAAGKGIVAAAAAQGKTILISDAMAQLNILASPLNTTQPVAAPTTPDASVAAPVAG
jgi:hypothetical protein